MSDEDENATLVTLAKPENRALRLKTLAEENYSSNNLESALKYAKRAHKLHPSLDGLAELLTAFRILSIAATPIFPAVQGSNSATPLPDYYKILDVERFTQTSTIKKQYRKLALTLHPDKSPFVASEEAFKLVAESVRVLSDRSKRKEYDTKLRMAMQSEAEAVSDVVVEEVMFSTLCSNCQSLHQFDRKYLGHDLMCTSCKKSFKAVEIEENHENCGTVGVEEKKGVETVSTRVSARNKEKAAKSGKIDILDKLGKGVKQKISSVEEVLDMSEVKMARNMSSDGGLVKSVKSKTVELDRNGVSDSSDILVYRRTRNAVHMDKNGNSECCKSDLMNESRLRRGGGKKRDAVKEVAGSDGVGMVDSERAKRAKSRGEETMTLAQFQMLAKKKVNEGKPMVKEKEGNKKLKVTEKDIEKEKVEKEKRDNDEREMEEEEKEEENELVIVSERRNLCSVSKNRSSKNVKRKSKNVVNLNIERPKSSKKGDVDVVLVENEEKEIEKTMVNTRGKRERQRVSKYSNLEFLKDITPDNDVDSEIEKLESLRRGNLEIMQVEDSDFYDFDMDRTERSFKKGQVWAVYDDKNGMPRHYALVDKVASVSPFQVMLSWLEFQSNGDDELISREKSGFQLSCGRFTVTRTVSVKYLNLFSHVVDCERVAREAYVIYPKKGSVWALYNNNNILDGEGRNQGIKDKPYYDIVVALTSYSDIYGLSVAFLEKVDGFRTVFKRKEIGAHAVLLLGKDDMKHFSHQIPSKKLSGEEVSGLPKDCWELDPGSLSPQKLIGS